MKYIAILDSENEFTEEVINDLKDTVFLGDNPHYAFKMLSIDKQEYKVGKWIKNSDCIATVREPFYYQCSICECPSRSNNHKFCPNCGSQMLDIPTGSD